tara:strand:+ start:3591 stop:4094 length:504 start_codon:yes stop_codon:yes gene_type:complete
MWWNILKKPYIIQTDEEYGKDYSWKFNRLFQGSQGDEDTGYWTPRLTEALVYAFFGSRADELKDISKPMIKQTIPTKEKMFLTYDSDYGWISRKKGSTPRGRPAYFNLEYKYLPDSRVKELGKKLLRDLEYDNRKTEVIEALRDSAMLRFDDLRVQEHLKKILDKYF